MFNNYKLNWIDQITNYQLNLTTTTNLIYFNYFNLPKTKNSD